MTQNTHSIGNNALKPTFSTPSIISRKIGNTTYNVSIHFSQTSKETVNDKILRLIRQESLK